MTTPDRYGEDWTLEMMAFDKGTLVAMLKEALVDKSNILEALRSLQRAVKFC